MRRFWLFFAQTLTITFAVLFIISIFKPGLLNRISLFDYTTPTQPAVATLAQTRPPPAQPIVSFRYAVEKANPAVVSIFTTTAVTRNNAFSQAPFFDIPFGNPNRNRRVIRNLGSGVILESNGLILTNNHVIQNAHRVIVSLADGSQFDGTVIGVDPENDL